jgi:hypothetical protein
MAEFEQARDELASRRGEHERGRARLLLAREAVRQAERALEEFARSDNARRRQASPARARARAPP